jgi:hypothetical protein
MTCARAQGFLAQKKAAVESRQDARRERLDRQAALELARRADTIIAARGKKVVRFDMRNAPPDEATLLGVLLGPGGHLRAPAILVGRTLIVGFHEGAYAELLGAAGAQRRPSAEDAERPS